MPKVDIKKQLAGLYRPPSGEVVEVHVPAMDFLMIDGAGDPDVCPAYAQAVEALFSISYALKFSVKRGPEAVDYSVMPLEGLWWADDMVSFESGDRSAWKWTMMIMQPEFVSREMVQSAVEDTAKKKSIAVDLIRFERFDEGRAAQTMHAGPFSAEGPTIAEVHGFIERSGSRRQGKHHEIYLSDIRRADPARWKTVIRQPMR